MIIKCFYNTGPKSRVNRSCQSLFTGLIKHTGFLCYIIYYDHECFMILAPGYVLKLLFSGKLITQRTLKFEKDKPWFRIRQSFRKKFMCAWLKLKPIKFYLLKLAADFWGQNNEAISQVKHSYDKI